MKRYDWTVKGGAEMTVSYPRCDELRRNTLF